MYIKHQFQLCGTGSFSGRMISRDRRLQILDLSCNHLSTRHVLHLARELDTFNPLITLNLSSSLVDLPTAIFGLEKIEQSELDAVFFPALDLLRVPSRHTSGRIQRRPQNAVTSTVAEVTRSVSQHGFNLEIDEFWEFSSSAHWLQLDPQLHLHWFAVTIMGLLAGSKQRGKILEVRMLHIANSFHSSSWTILESARVKLQKNYPLVQFLF